MKSRDYYLIFSTIFLLAVYIVNATYGQSLGDLSVIFPFAIIPPGVVFGIAR
jgi:hypothetical protein